MKYVKGAKIITETQVLEDHVLGFEEKITEIVPDDTFNSQSAEIIDAEGLYIAPGLVDIHIHGRGGKDVMDGSKEGIRTISNTIAQNGVTSFLATTMTMDWDKIYCALGQIRKVMGERMPGAQLIGAHLEGPFISPEFKGAQNENYIATPDWELIKEFKDVIKIVTLAPELQNSKDFIHKLKENQIIASMGHTSATYKEAEYGIDAGITHCTHLFNAMTGIHHRNPGAAAIALSGNIYCEVIADNIHIHPGLYELVRKAKGLDKIILITDCMEAGGLKDGTYSLGGQPVIVKDGAARLQDGTLAGSVLKLNHGVRNFFKNTNINLQDAFRLASLNPASELGLDKHKGSIAMEKDADFFLMDADFNVKATYVKGKRVF